MIGLSTELARVAEVERGRVMKRESDRKCLNHMHAQSFYLCEVAIVRTHPRAILLPMDTMRKSIHGFLFPYMVIGLHLAAAFGPPELRNNQDIILLL